MGSSCSKNAEVMGAGDPAAPLGGYSSQKPEGSDAQPEKRLDVESGAPAAAPAAPADPPAQWKEKFNAAFALSQGLLASPSWANPPGETDAERLVRRASLIKEAGGPELRLLHWAKILELRRIPRSSEGHTISVDQAVQICAQTGRKLRANVLSHRWALPRDGRPDDESNSKAKAVVRFSKYGKDVYGGEEFWWIDYACVDQDDTAAGIAFLPTYIASVEGLICFDRLFSADPVDDYFLRPWCRIEIMTALTYTTPRLWFYDPDPGEGPTSDLKPKSLPNNAAGWFHVRDPLEEAVVKNLTCPADEYALRKIRDLAVAAFPRAHAAWIGDHQRTNPGVLDFQRNKAMYWRMEAFVRYQKVGADGWLLWE
mmetsp:Transcript_34243/g.66897  ORF Transcript_34243/g.66897 Transcript_34243/m.66897 type:complete len:369 (+) Transcript_34243:274-1380(+)|eukprot:CAMPEP_0173414058 /NCGR_PEP_ID=MMETSP1356-20130122/83526_1 /TAXON_ID=77927 ORGANISM="Hemiselmis virescens, Strain PCC157" /NCGR_SAMPLE_ID=MMETSP1356 /ASSEMBLY_ACC=CAM_ASM_000847 /LENGTH=368 /DNA_ID=CAMNT_0014376175 /DNA_START=190 /DNA_END=1296 /DNA_ORIENTATION=-